MRIMTFNIWGDYFGNPCDVRENGIFDTCNSYSPDVLGLQEITDGWYKSNLFTRLSDNYYFVGTELFDNTNYVPMAIKKCHKLLSKGYEMLEETPDASKAITWAVITDNESKKRVALCNTHFWWMAGKQEYDELRAKNALQMRELMRYLQQRFNCPVFAFGDMNCTRQSMAFKSVYNLCGIRHLSDLADEADDICTIHGNPVADKNGFYHGTSPVIDYSMSIDHIISMGEGFKVLNYKVVTDAFALDATDHCPVYSDIVL